MSDLPLFDLSIVLPTRDRADALLRAIMGIERATHCAHEVIVVDGGNDRATDGVLMLASSIMGPRLRVVREGVRVGLGSALNRGMRVARGRHVCALADDVHPLDGALDRAVAQLDDADECDRSIVALFAEPDEATSVALDREIAGRRFAVGHVRGTLVADYPVARREAFRALPFDVTLASAAAVVDFSLAAWNAGVHVRPAIDGAVIRHADAIDSPIADVEHARVAARWALPPAGASFDLATPCTLARKAAARHAA